MSTLIDAVNDLLIERGIAPVQTIVAGHPYVDAAVSILNRQGTLIQDRGWWFNRDYKIQLTRNESNRVQLPNDVIRMDGPASYNVQVDVDGNKWLYNTIEHSTIFTEDPDTVDLIRKRDWTNIPPTAFAYIVAVAKEIFIRPLESPARSTRVEREVERTKAMLFKAELDNLDPNTMTGNPLMLKLLSRMKVR